MKTSAFFSESNPNFCGRQIAPFFSIIRMNLPPTPRQRFWREDVGWGCKETEAI